MADENVQMENPFGVQNTLEMGGIGDATLVQDLLAPETSTADPDELKGIGDETTPPDPPEQGASKGKTIIPPKEMKEGETEDDTPSGQELISSFLGSDEDEEEQEEETEKKEPPKQELEEEHQEEEFNQYGALAKDLYKIGVFNTEEGEEPLDISSPEEFLELFNTQKQKGASEMIDNFLGQFGEDYKRAFDAIYVKGVNPKEYFTTYNEIANLAELDLTQELNQESVLRQSLTEQGYEPDDITAEVERLKNYGDLEQVATRHHKVLVKKEAQKLQQKENEAALIRQQKEATRAQFIQNVQTVLQDKVKAKEFDGIPFNPKLANELQDFLLVDKWKTATGETLTDFDRTILELKKPENHAMKVKVAALLKILEKDPTLSTIQRSAITKKSDGLFETLAKQKTKVSSVRQQQNTKNSFFNGL